MTYWQNDPFVKNCPFNKIWAPQVLIAENDQQSFLRIFVLGLIMAKIEHPRCAQFTQIYAVNLHSKISNWVNRFVQAQFLNNIPQSYSVAHW